MSTYSSLQHTIFIFYFDSVDSVWSVWRTVSHNRYSLEVGSEGVPDQAGYMVWGPLLSDR